MTLPDDRLHERRPVISSDGLETVRPSIEKDQAILTLARQRFLTSMSAESVMRQNMLEDQRFYGAQQWPDNIKAERAFDKRPVLTINRLPQFVKQITNPQRSNRPAIQVNPVSDGADQDTAEVIQGIIRHIESTSHAEVAYDEAYEDAVVMGRGWFRILTEFVHDGSFEQEIVVRRVSDPFTIYPDPSAQELDYSDARYMFVLEDVPKDEYREIYGDMSMASLEIFQGMGSRTPEWFPEGKVRIAEYWFVENVPRKISLVEMPTSDGGKTYLTVPTEFVPAGVTVVRERTVNERVIHWTKINGAEVLEHKIWPGKWIPIVAIVGDEHVIDGKKDLVGVVRYARDPQRMYNYWVTALTEVIALAPRAPIIGAEGQFRGHEEKWKTANIRNHAYLEYKEVSLEGKLVGPPQRQQFEPPIAAIVAATKQADNDLKAVIGFFDASLGEAGPDESGKAILARQKQGETANINYIDNFARGLWHAGRIYVDLIPNVFDSARVVHILGGDEQRRRVVINEEWIVKGVPKLYDVRVGRYDVTMSVGTNYQSRRQESTAALLQLVAAAPTLIPIIGDLMVREMDWPMARQISERLKKALPPQLQDGDDGEEQPVPPKIAAQLATLQQAQMLLQQALQQANEVIRTKQIETASREMQVQLQEQTKLTIALAKLDAETARLRMEAELSNITNSLDANNTRVMDELSDIRQAHQALSQTAQAQQHERDQTSAAQQHEGQQADLTRQHEAEQADLTRQHEADQQAKAAAQPTTQE